MECKRVGTRFTTLSNHQLNLINDVLTRFISYSFFISSIYAVASTAVDFQFFFLAQRNRTNSLRFDCNGDHAVQHADLVNNNDHFVEH